MEAWRERGYAPPGSERMLQDYEDKLELERNKQDLIYALKYPPAPPPPPPPSPEDTRNEVYARLYPPSNGPAPEPQLEDLSDGTLGVAGDVHAIRRVLDAGGVEHYLPFRHSSIVIGLPDVAKARNVLEQDRQARANTSTYRDGDVEQADLRWGSPVDARQLGRPTMSAETSFAPSSDAGERRRLAELQAQNYPSPAREDAVVLAANGPALGWMAGRSAPARQAGSAAPSGPPKEDPGLRLKIEPELGAHGAIHGKLTFDAEGNDNGKSPFFSRQLHWPGGYSGVTLGRGYDMRGRTEEQVVQDLTAAGLDEDKAKAFAKGAGLRGDNASQFVRDNRVALGEIPREVQSRLFNAVYPGYARTAENQYAKATAGLKDATPWGELDQAVREVATDFAYQQGSLKPEQLEVIQKNDAKALQDYINGDSYVHGFEPGRHRVQHLERRR